MGINMEDTEVELLAARFVCKNGIWPNTYLGLPLNGKYNTSSFWDPMLEKVRKKLSTWEPSSYLKVEDLHLYKPLSQTSLFIIFPSFLAKQRALKI